MTRIVYFDPWAGASGDMLLGALLSLDSGEDLLGRLDDAVNALGLPGVRVEAWRDTSRGVGCVRVNVIVPPDAPTHDLTGFERVLAEAATLSPVVRDRALAALRRLAKIEGGIHNVPPADVHFHELGGADTIVDVVGTFALLEALLVEGAYHGPLPLGSGTVDTEHGRLGVPAPATLELLTGVPVLAGPERSELTTPTGALLLTEAADPVAGIPPMVVERAGFGGGARTLEHGPNVLRALLGEAAPDMASHEAAPPAEAQVVVVLEANIDDGSAEVAGHLLGLVMAAGALDAWWSPVLMKKGRPGLVLSVLCRPADEVGLVDLVFRESTTFGVRRSERFRHVLERETVHVLVDGQTVGVKIGRRGGLPVTVATEFEDAARAAEILDLPLKEVMARAAEGARRLLEQ